MLGGEAPIVDGARGLTKLSWYVAAVRTSIVIRLYAPHSNPGGTRRPQRCDEVQG